MNDHILIVAIDDAALEGLAYTSPINRNLLASVVQRLDKLGASVIGVDILLDRPSEPAADQALAEVIVEARAPVILVSDPGRAARESLCSNRPIAATNTNILPMFSDAARLAHGVQCVDTLDDVLRRAPVARGGLMSFAEAVAEADRELVLPEANWMSVLFNTGERAAWPFRTFSAANIDVLPEDWVRGRIVLIGGISPYSGDFVSTPLRFNTLEAPIEPRDLLPTTELPGVIVHAFTVAGLLDGRRGHHLTVWSQLPYVLIGAFLGAAIGAIRFNLLATLAALAASLAIYWWLVFSVFRFTEGNWLLPFTGFASAVLIVSGILFAAQERQERARRKIVQDGFSHFLSEDRVNQIMKSPNALSLTAEERDLSILFTDLEGFTNLVDTMQPTKLAPTLNGYLDKIVDAVIRYDGTVDKIVGDAVHAMFSAPLDVPEHRLKALLCALDVLDVSRSYQQAMQDQGVALGRTRIGISCGAALVGNFGSSKRFDYTAHGSIVNLAARLEAANKAFGTSICLAEASRVETDLVSYREVGDIAVRGIVKPVRVYEAFRAGLRSGDQLRDYGGAFEALDTDLSSAIERFEALHAADPEDGLVAYQLEQAKALLSQKS